MSFWKQFKPKSCSIALKASSKEEALTEIVDNLIGGGVLDAALRDAAVAALLAREELASTGVGQNVAIPHVKLAGIEQAVSSVSVHKEGLEWAAVDGDVVNVFFTVLRPDEPTEQHDPERHLEMMRWIARLGRDSDFRNFALQVKNRTELVDLLKEMSGV